MAQYDGSIRINTQINTKQAQVNLSTLENRIVKTSDKIASLRSKMDALKDTKIPTQEYQEISTQIQKSELEFNKLLEKQEQMQREGKDNGVAWDRLNAKMEEVGNTIRYAQGELQDLVDAGKAFTLGSDTEEFEKLSQQLKYAEDDLSVLNKHHDILLLKQKKNSDGYKKLGSSARKSMQSVGQMLKNAKSHAASLGNTLKNIAYRIFPFLNRSAKKSGGLLKTMGTRFKGLALSLLIFNQISKAFNSMISGIKEGLGSLAQYSAPVNATLSAMKSSLTQLKNSLATAFAPILTTIAPILTTFINMLSRAVTYVGMFIAALTGQKTFTKATAIQENYAESLKGTASAAKEANKQLSSLDKLNNLTTQGSGGGGSGTGGATSPEDMFETVEIPGAISDLAAKIREYIKKGDWESVGEAINESLISVMERINWKSIYKKAQNFGTGLANFLNGLISPGLFSSVGKTIAGSLNTALHFLDTFGTTFDWKGFGDSISAGINSFFENYDLKLAVKNFNTFANGILTTMVSSIRGIRWDDISQAIADAIGNIDAGGISWKVGSLVSSMLNAFYTLVSNKSTWLNLGSKIADGINGFFASMGEIDAKTGLTGWQALGLSIANALNGFKDTLVEAFNGLDWDEIKTAVGDVIESFFEEIDIGTVGIVVGAIAVRNLWKIPGLFKSALGSPAVSGITLAVAGLLLSIENIDAILSDEYKNTSVTSAIKTAISGLLLGAGAAILLGTGLAIPIGVVLAFGITDIVVNWENYQSMWASEYKAFENVLAGDFSSAISDLQDAMLSYITMDSWTIKLQQKLVDLIGGEGTFDSVLEFFTNDESAFKKTIEYAIAKFLNAFSFSFDARDIFKIFEPLGEDIYHGIIEGFINQFGSIGQTISSFFDKIWSGICSIFGIHSPSKEMEPLGGNILLGIIEGFKGAFSNIGSAIGKFFTDVKNSFANKISGFGSYWQEKWNGLKESVINIFGGMWSGIKGPINSIIGGIERMANGVISGINGVIRSLNNLSFTVPEWVPGIGGGTFGFNIPTLSQVSIPRLATGTVVPPNREFLAVLGDNKREPEVVSPLSTIEQAVENAIRRNGGMGGGEVTIKIPVEIDGRVLFELMKKFDLEQYRRTGRPSFLT